MDFFCHTRRAFLIGVAGVWVRRSLCGGGAVGGQKVVPGRGCPRIITGMRGVHFHAGFMDLVLFGSARGAWLYGPVRMCGVYPSSISWEANPYPSPYFQMFLLVLSVPMSQF